MKGLIAAMLSLGLAAVPAPAKAQTSSTPDKTAAPTEGVARIGAGIVIPAELTKSLDSKKLKEGDPINAKLSMDLLSGGKVAIPRGSKIVGHVTESKARSKGDSESTLGIAFDRLILKNGQQVPMRAMVQAVGAPIGSATLQQGFPTAQTPSANAGANGGMSSPKGGRATQPSGNNGPASIEETPLLAPDATGVVGLSGLTLRNTSSPSSVLASDKKNVKLDSGTQLLLRTSNP